MEREKVFKKVLDKAERDIGFRPHIVFMARVGSEAYNLKLSPKADVDVLGAFVSPLRHYIGLSKIEHWMPQEFDGIDVKLYEWRKFMRLLMKQNPSLAEVLFLREKDYIHRTSWFNELLRNKHRIVSKGSFNSFSGYARGMVAEIMSDMEASTIRTGRMGAERKKLVSQFGYDPKNASHLIRLLKMGIELMTSGDIQVYRTHDAEQLKSIKRGEWEFEDIMSLSDRLFIEAEKALERSSLPEQADKEYVEQIIVDVISSRFQIPLQYNEKTTETI